MEKNINFNYKNLSPFKWFVLENFPFIEADFDALTEWQLFCKLGKEINKIINSVNLSGEQVEKLTNGFNDLQNYVNNYFANLDIQEEINNKLNEMTEDGTLARIINQEIFGEINTKINNLTNDVTLINNNKHTFNNINLTNFGSTSDNGNQQGMCIDKVNNIMYIYTETNYPIGKITAYNLTNGLQMNVYENIQGFHGNSLLYKNNKIYIATVKNDSGDTNTNTNIIVFDLSTLTTTTLSMFNNIADFVWGLTDYVENKILVALANTNDNFNNILLYTLDITTNVIEKKEITNTYNIYTEYTWHQDICYTNNHLYILCSESNQLIDLLEENNTFNVISILNLENNDNFGQFIGEVEGIDIINNYGNATMLLFSKYYEPEISRNMLIFDLINPIFGINQQLQKIWRPQYAFSNFVYVNSNNNTIFKTGINSQSGFNNLHQAVLFKKYNKLGINVINIAIDNIEETTKIKLYNTNNLNIYSTKSLKFDTFQLICCTNIVLHLQSVKFNITNIIIDNSKNITLSNININKLTVEYSTLYLNTVTLNATANNFLKILMSKVDFGIVINKNNFTLSDNAIENLSIIIQSQGSNDYKFENRTDLKISPSCVILKSAL